jgi:hypothetical protein
LAAEQWRSKVRKKSYLIVALVLALLVSSCLYASAYTTAVGSIPVELPPGDVVSWNATATQPDWDSILDALSTENKTCGEVPTGDLFVITPNGDYTLTSREISEWEEGWTVTPELYCEVTQR